MGHPRWGAMDAPSNEEAAAEETEPDSSKDEQIWLVVPDLKTPLLVKSLTREDDEREHPYTGTGESLRRDSDDDSSPRRLRFDRDEEDEAALAATGKASLRQVVAETGRLTHIALPILCQYGFNYLLATISLAFVGRLGALPLAGASIATIIVNVLGLSLSVGLAGGMETLCGQAYGAGRYRQVGEVAQRAIVILHVVAIPLVVVLWNVEDILRYSGQDPHVSTYAGRYIRCLIPSLITNIWGSVLEKYLQAQSLVFPLALGSGISFVFHIPINYLLIYGLDFGYAGAAVATSVSYFVNLFVLAVYVLVTGVHKKTWHGWSWSCLQHWGQYFRIAVPSCLMTCLGWWCIDMITFAAGYFRDPKVKLSAMSIGFNVLFIAFVFPLSLSVAVSTRVSNELGAGRPLRAKLSATVATVAAILVGLVGVMIICCLRHDLFLIYTNRSEVAVSQLTSTLIPYVAGMHFSNWIIETVGGVLGGSGRQNFGAAATFLTSYGLSFPLSLYMAFGLGMEVIGLWAGLLVGYLLRGGLLLGYSLSIDWEAEAARAELLTREILAQ